MRAGRSGRLGGLDELQGQSAERAPVDPDADLVLSRLGEREPLEVQDEIAGQEERFRRKRRNLEIDVRTLLDGDEMAAIWIDEEDLQLVRPAVLLPQQKPERNGALGMDRGVLLGPDGVEGAEDAKLALIVGGEIAKRSQDEFHDDGRRQSSAGGCLP